LKLLQRISDYYKRLALKLQQLSEHVFFARPVPVARKNSLLLLRLDSIGDYVLFRNFIEALKTSDRYKNYEITLCGNLWWKDLAEQLDAAWIKEFIWVDYHRLNDFAYRRQVYRQIRAGRFEVLIHPTYSRDAFSDAVAIHSGARQKIGSMGDLINLSPAQKLRNDREYTLLLPATGPYEFEFFRNRYFFEALLGKLPLIERPQIVHPASVRNRIIVCPGAKIAARRWAPGRFAALCDLLQADFPGAEFAICGAAADQPFAQEIEAASAIPFVNYCGTLNLAGLLDVFSQARLIVTNDSGPFHMAVALDKNVVCLSNGNNYGRFSPYPESMGTCSAVVYPRELLNIRSEAERLMKFCREGSPLNINSIEVSAVHEAIKTIMFARQ
jgi:ADP-heptose:LPS heptosyltransferase